MCGGKSKAKGEARGRDGLVGGGGLEGGGKAKSTNSVCEHVSSLFLGLW